MHIRASLDELTFGENPPTLRAYTHIGDVKGIMRILEFFHDLPVEVEFDYFSHINERMKNVVLLGASSRSDVSREVAAELYKRGIRVHGDKQHAHFDDLLGNEYHCQHAEVAGRQIVAKDAGVVFRMVTDNGATILMCGGIHTFGSQAAAEVALTNEFQRMIRKKGLRQFVQFVTVDVMTTGEQAGLVYLTQTIRWKDLPILDWEKLE